MRLFTRIKKRIAKKNDYSQLFAEFGNGSVLCKPLSIMNPEYVSIGHNTTIMMNARIDCWDSYEGKRLSPKLTIGNNTQIGLNFTAICTDDLAIGDNVLIASGVFIATHNHGMNPEKPNSYQRQPLTSNKVIIQDGSWLGERVVILSGVTIGKKTIIGANSVVTKSIPDYSIAVGIPARVIKQWDFETHEWKSV